MSVSSTRQLVSAEPVSEVGVMHRMPAAVSMTSAIPVRPAVLAATTAATSTAASRATINASYAAGGAGVGGLLPLQRAEVQYGFVATTADQLSVSEQDLVTVVGADSGDGWTLVSLKGQTGLVPTAYLRRSTSAPPAGGSKRHSGQPPSRPSQPAATINRIPAANQVAQQQQQQQQQQQAAAYRPTPAPKPRLTLAATHDLTGESETDAESVKPVSPSKRVTLADGPLALSEAPVNPRRVPYRVLFDYKARTATERDIAQGELIAIDETVNVGAEWLQANGGCVPKNYVERTVPAKPKPQNPLPRRT
jgi:hypothetical protein